MAVTLHVDYESISTWVEEVENAEAIKEDRDCKVLNIHANFVIPQEQRHEDLAFPHLPLMVAMAERGVKAGSVISAEDTKLRSNERPYRRPDFDAEWKLLKKAWSLHRRGKQKLSDRLIEGASAEFYANDPLKDIPDWIWRFALFSTGIDYEPRFRAAMDVIKKPLHEGKLNDIITDLQSSASERGEQYHSIIREYFSSWSEFSQVHFSVGSGIDTTHLSAKTSNFASIQMYYGNAFEMFGSMIDILTMINNVLAGRRFDQLSSISLAQYRASDKGKRFDAPTENNVFADTCFERDNQLRNASHHRELHYDQATGMVCYNVGKGGSGGLREMPYAEYLTKCSRLHHQIIVLLRIHLLLSEFADATYPI
ncbi:hypothetical protein Sbs19_09630 [Sphingobium sp. BS19]|nr:hypothetical protein Sbs19_09630 [Sphingobium sp. BS19]